MIGRAAHLDPRFKRFANLREEEYESILAVPILAKERLEGALNVRTRDPHEFTGAEIELLMAIAGQVAQAIENAKLYATRNDGWSSSRRWRRSPRRSPSRSTWRSRSRRSCGQLWRRSARSARRSSSRTAGSRGRGPRRRSRRAAAAALEGPADRRARLRPRHPFTGDERKLLASIASQAAVALEHGRTVMRGVLAQEIHHRVEEQPPDVASLSACRPGHRASTPARRSTTRSTASSPSRPSTRS